MRLLKGAFVVGILFGLGLGSCMGPAQGGSAQPAELLERGDRAFNGGRFAESAELYKLAAASASTHGDSTAFLEAAAQVSSSLSLLGRPEEGESWLAQVRARDDEKLPRAHARVMLAEALNLRDTGQTASALHQFDGLFAFCMDGQLFGEAMQAATLASVVAEGDARLAWAERNLDAARASEEPAWVVAAWRGLGFAQEAVGKYEEAVYSMRQAREGTAAGGRPGLRADWALAHMLRLSGKLAEADRILTAAVPQARRFHAQGFSPRDAEWLGRCFEEYAEVQAATGQKRNALVAMGSARKAYMLAEIDSLAPEKLRALDARLAQWKYDLDGVQKP
ncbi:MAG: tetratricopeptide repeat protein [Planctomycetes bacterium]|nr:tetratricopeptide repeat protein [Planctomycetota bacterium]